MMGYQMTIFHDLSNLFLYRIVFIVTPIVPSVNDFDLEIIFTNKKDLLPKVEDLHYLLT